MKLKKVSPEGLNLLFIISLYIINFLFSFLCYNDKQLQS